LREELREKAGLVYNVVEAVLLAISIGLVTWTANNVIAQGKELAKHETQIDINTSRITTIETKGSAGLQTHEQMDDTRIGSLNSRLDKVEQAVIGLQSAPAKLEAISARLESLAQGQQRIERQLEQHMDRAQNGGMK
jgi:hypothetical protein